MCGRALEGITKSIIPKGNRTESFAKSIDKLPDHVEIQKTITDLSHAIRRGRNIASHFDEDIDIDQETAEMLLDLLDSVIEYLFVRTP